MFSKSKFVSERSNSDRPDKRLRRNASDLFLSGAISAGRAATVFQDAEFDGATGVADLAVNEGKNAQRDLVRKLMKGSKYVAATRSPGKYYVLELALQTECL